MFRRTAGLHERMSLPGQNGKYFVLTEWMGVSHTVYWKNYGEDVLIIFRLSFTGPTGDFPGNDI